ncbi:Crp/Fnr family transcriptional regulator [Leifsonia bigeumensis]|uniref:Crp/Fnr family transcriptional regulator n=1 Tax=Leifsonella bigeumensis TaxID=433643 RepID=A0ABP7FH58_9MICO
MDHHHGCESGGDGAHAELEALVAKVPLFAGLTHEQISEIASRVRPRVVPRNQQLYGAGDINPYLRIIHTGTVKVYRITESGHEQVIRVLGSGDFLGEKAVISPSASDHFAVTLDESEICSLDHEDMRSYLLRYPSVAFTMLETLSARLGTTEEQVSAMTGEDAAGRVAAYLVGLADEYHRSSFLLPISKKDVASYLGLTPETLSRRLAAFEDNGWIHLHGSRRVDLLDIEALRLV